MKTVDFRVGEIEYRAQLHDTDTDDEQRDICVYERTTWDDRLVLRGYESAGRTNLGDRDLESALDAALAEAA